MDLDIFEGTDSRVLAGGGGLWGSLGAVRVWVLIHVRIDEALETIYHERLIECTYTFFLAFSFLNRSVSFH